VRGATEHFYREATQNGASANGNGALNGSARKHAKTTA
jgi:hypothetical protein